MIESPTFEIFPSNSTTTVLNVSIDGTSATEAASPEAMFFIGGSSYSLRCKLSPTSDTLSIASIDPTDMLTEIPGSPFAFPYEGGAVSFTITFTSNSLRVSSTLNTFDTGQLLFSGLGVENFDVITDLGPQARITLLSEASAGNGTATVRFDRVSYETDAALVVAPDNSALRKALLAKIKKLQAQAKSAKQAGKTAKLKKLSGKIKTLKKQLAAL